MATTFLRVKPGQAFPIRGVLCPECGGELRAEVTEWYSRSGIPTPGGLLVWCEYDDPYDPKDWNGVAHGNAGTDWIPIQAGCERWAEQNVRVQE
jgi:hypothetical protein